MAPPLADQVSELVRDVLMRLGAGAEIERRAVKRLGVADGSEIVINVLPYNDSAATIQAHVEDSTTIDVTLGQGSVLEFFASANGDNIGLMRHLDDIFSAVVSGRFRESVRRRHGKIGSVSGAIQTQSRVIKARKYDTTVGWLFSKAETIQYTPYAPGEVRIREGMPINLP